MKKKTLLDVDIEDLCTIHRRLDRHAFAYGGYGDAQEQIFDLAEEILLIIKRLTSISESLPF